MFTLFCTITMIALSNANSLCQFSVDGDKIDLTPLTALNGSFTWTASSDSDQFPNNTYTFEMQFCGPVKSSYKNCENVTQSAINRIVYPITNDSECVSLGQYNIVAFDATPSSLNGVVVNYYHGTYINHITALNTAVYIECDENQEMSGITYRHIRMANDSTLINGDNNYIGGQSHFKLYS